MFSYAKVFNGDISSWDVSNVVSMDYMFFGAYKFNQDIGNWDVSNAMHMKNMFYHARAFNQNLSNWNISKVGDNKPANFNSDSLLQESFLPKAWQ
jgi:surface protein